ncbi:MAG: hypothetical protein EHM55_16730 [Acidobacteria bacterium]|nr:MAG: hypothetical protein EHM55_16730 [Acidobacteriota bacterium]
MKLIVVNRAKPLTFQRLANQFAGVHDVKVLLDRRVKQIRNRQEEHFPERRRSDRRRLIKTWLGRDYIVIHLADKPNGESSK